MTLDGILDNLEVKHYKDRIYIRKVVNICNTKKDDESFTHAIKTGLDRDYSTFKKRAKNIVTTSANEEKLKQFLNIDSKASGKQFIEKIAEKVRG